MINKANDSEVKEGVQAIVAKYPDVFKGIGKLRNHQVKFYVNENVNPVAVPPRAVPYHLKSRYDKAIKEMLEADIIEEHPVNEPAVWISPWMQEMLIKLYKATIIPYHERRI